MGRRVWGTRGNNQLLTNNQQRRTQRENQLPARVLPKAQYCFTTNQQRRTPSL
ncbi:MAG: hypothetical protein ACHBN1_33830 [Heteroscytonema crispum UTEX LB 1556]